MRRSPTISEGGLVVPLLAEQMKRGWSLMIFCARATRGRRLPSLDARSGRSIMRAIPEEIDEQAWKEHFDVVRRAQLGTKPGRPHEEK